MELENHIAEEIAPENDERISKLEAEIAEAKAILSSLTGDEFNFLH